MIVKKGYKTIYDTLKQQIEERVIESGNLLPPESELAARYGVSRPTIAKVYNKLQDEGYVLKRKGYGTEVIYRRVKRVPLFGLLLPGAGESEIFAIINDQLLELSGKGMFDCLWDGATANNAKIRSDFLEVWTNDYIKKGVDGIFFSPLERVPEADAINSYICSKIDQAGIPIVLIDRDIVDFPARSKYDLICIDNYNAGFVMGQHLIDRGCDTIYFFCRPNSAYSVQQRISGVSAAARQNHLEFHGGHIFCGSPDDVEFVRGIPVRGRVGVVCANDATAALLMSSFDELGKVVGRDLLICGFDDMKYAQHLKYPLTSYRQPCEEIANVGVELMFRRVGNRDIIPVTVTLNGEILERESTRFAVK